MSAVGGAVLAGAAVLLAFPPSRACADLRLLGFAVVGLAGWGGVWFGTGLQLPLVLIAAVVAWAAYQLVEGRRARVAADRRAAAVIDLCEGLAADLRAGQSPLVALHVAVREWPEFAPVADAGRLGGDVPAALRRLAEEPGAGGLRAVAAAWVIAHRSGAGLAEAVGLAARTVRDEKDVARVVETEMAAARSTARLLAVLPLGVLLIGRGAGGDPFGFLFDSLPGLLCLSSGLALTGAGLAWLERIARSVQG